MAWASTQLTLGTRLFLCFSKGLCHFPDHTAHSQGPHIYLKYLHFAWASSCALGSLLMLLLSSFSFSLFCFFLPFLVILRFLTVADPALLEYISESKGTGGKLTTKEYWFFSFALIKLFARLQMLHGLLVLRHHISIPLQSMCLIMKIIFP